MAWMGSRPHQWPTGGKQLMPDEDHEVYEVLCRNTLQTLIGKVHDNVRAKPESSVNV